MSQMLGPRRLGPRLGTALGLASLLMVGCSWPRWAPGGDEAEAIPHPPGEAAVDHQAESLAASAPAPESPSISGRLSARAPVLPPRDPAAAEVACRPEVDDEGRVRVADHDLPLRFARDQHHRLPRLAVWPYRSDAVLVAQRPRWRLNQAAPTDGTLWLVACDGASAPVPAVSRPGADFGNAVLGSDGSALLFTGPAGVERLDLHSRAITTITQAPPITDASCDDLYGARAPTHHRDVVRGLDRKGRLVFERGSYCGFEGDWEGQREVVRLPAESSTPT